MARIVAKTIGIIMLFAMYKNTKKANKPMKKTDAFAYNGNFNFSSVTAFQYSFPFCVKNVETGTGRMF